MKRNKRKTENMNYNNKRRKYLHQTEHIFFIQIRVYIASLNNFTENTTLEKKLS